MKKLTIKQKMVFEYINWFVSEHGFSPTIREIQKGLKLKYPNSVFEVLMCLEKYGYISTTYGKARTIKVLRSDIDEKN